MNFKEILFFNLLFACFYSGIVVAIVAYSTKQLDFFSILGLGLFATPILSAFLLFFPSLKKEKIEEKKREFFEKKKEGGEDGGNEQRSSFD